MIRYLGAVALVAVASGPAFAVGPNCGDQLAQIKAQLSSEQLAQSAEAKQYQEAERLCSAGNQITLAGVTATQLTAANFHFT